MLKITFILPCLQISGGVISTIELANRLFLKGYKVTIVYPKILVKPRLKWHNIRSIWSTLNYNNISKKKLYNRIVPKCEMLNVTTLNENNIPDADVIFATWWETAYHVNTYSLKKGAKFYFVRGYEIWYGNKQKVDETLKYPLKIITTSTNLKATLRQLGVNAIGVIPNGVNLNLFYRTERPLRNGKNMRIGMVYRDISWKGMHDGFKAFEIVKEKYPKVKLVLFGSPIGTDVPKDIEHHIYPDMKKLRYIYNSLDIFMLPSHEGEGFSNPPMEAMACEVACVLTNVGGVPDYTIPGETALVSPPHDPLSLSENILKLILNDNKRISMAKRGKEYMNCLSWDKSTSKLEVMILNNIK